MGCEDGHQAKASTSIARRRRQSPTPLCLLPLQSPEFRSLLRPRLLFASPSATGNGLCRLSRVPLRGEMDDPGPVSGRGGGGGRGARLDRLSVFFFFFDRPRCFARRDGRTSRRLLLLLDREEGTLFCALEQAPRRFDERREARCGKKREIIIARDWKKSRRRRRRPLLPPSLTLSTCPPLSHKNLSLSLSLLSPGQNIRKLVKDGFILKKPSKIHSRSRARSAAEAKAKGRHTGYGKRRG